MATRDSPSCGVSELRTQPQAHLHLHGIQPGHVEPQQPVSPGGPRDAGVVQAARHVAERGPVLTEAVPLEIDLERARREGGLRDGGRAGGSIPSPAPAQVHGGRKERDDPGTTPARRPPAPTSLRSSAAASSSTRASSPMTAAQRLGRRRKTTEETLISPEAPQRS